jgi:hypothetical protein
MFGGGRSRTRTAGCNTRSPAPLGGAVVRSGRDKSRSRDGTGGFPSGTRLHRSPGALRSLYLVLGGLHDNGPHRSKQSWIAGSSATDRPTRETGLYTLPGLAGPRLLASSLIPRPPPTNMESSCKLPRKRGGEEDPCPSDSVRAKLGFIGKYLNKQYLPPCPAGHFDCAVIPPQYICLCQQNSTPWSIPMDAPSVSADQEGWPNSSVCPVGDTSCSSKKGSK